MKVSDHLLNEILEGTTHDFETMGVWVRTEHCTDEGFCIDYRYNDATNNIVDLQFFMSDNPVTVTDEQLNIIFLFALDLHNQELESEAEHRKRSMDDDYDDRGIDRMMFI